MLKQCFANCAWPVPPTSAFLTHTQNRSRVTRLGEAETRSGRARRPGRFRTRCRCCSDGADVLGLVALASGTDVELDLLTLLEGAVSRPLDRGEVDEHVVPALARDEAETLFGVEELHSACSQLL